MAQAAAGYEYLINVSVWLAVDLVLASRLAQQLILESASEDDIEADLDELRAAAALRRSTATG
ncbi:hypothetical protein GPL17_33585 [Bradyrhizobium yuanmingense]|uniref:hypothetical protein n=1 Tax=Bradyrhizobium yuanmingense TaxID=108015 RepID=UPI0012F7ABC6|nr:hypothetical protein [Bradyrhizobium yuanmingense]MVT55366.1 hypothetical protein [Bradyrhizobium yuanmingense]